MAPLVSVWYLSSLDTERAVPVTELRSLVQANSPGAVIMNFPGPLAAFAAAKSACKGDDRVCVFGSFYLVGDILAHRERLGI